MERLATVMRVQAAVFAAYAVGWFFIPNFVNDTILGWDSGSFWPRMIGGAFFGVALLEWNVVQDLRNRFDLVLPFALIPLGFLAALILERLLDNYPGSDLFWWVSVLVTAVLGIAVLALRQSAASEVAVPRR